MAKEKSEAEIREKKERKEKKRKLEEVEGAAVEKKKKDKKRKSTDATVAVLNTLEAERPGSVAVDADGDIVVDAPAVVEEVVDVKVDIPLAALVPFANPLCDDKAQKKVLKSVKKGAKHKTLKRGVKEVVKAVRKSPLNTPSSTGPPPGIVVLAADISPMDVISHIPVLCEDHGIPYVYVPSRAELGAAGSTKRPTSVVMLLPKAKGEEAADWDEVYAEVLKLTTKLGQYVRV